ncbi:DUF418 domain-containing protein [Nocardiopsis tropica]|uniref:DUF418 domain-containing protein n=1 Tax=Nocardiopsis tropica TaxID=109330 RepID=A0ABV2A0B9_9ACTN
MTIRDPDRPPTPSTGPVRPTPLSERSLAPDLARGMMLLLIALAHVPYFLYTAQAGMVGVHPVEGGAADRIAQAFTLIVVDARVYTMFGFLFAYGIGQMYARQTAKGAGAVQTRRLLRRRHLWMIVFGAVHALLLWQGDIIGMYGLIGLVMVPLFFHRSDRTLKVWIGVLLGLAALVSLAGALATTDAGGAVAAEVQRASIAESSYPVSAAVRLPVWVVQTITGSAQGALPAAFLMGVLAARHRLLDEPGRHLVLLRRLALWGIAAGWTTGAVLALQHTTSLEFGPVSVLTGVHFVAGIFTGVGYAALFGLVAHRLSGRAAATARPVRWIGALGRRSMSGYLAQSLVWGPVLAAWGLGLGAHLSSWSVSLLAVVTWAATVAGAAVLERSGRRGPAEVLLRKLTYRPARSRN